MNTETPCQIQNTSTYQFKVVNRRNPQYVISDYKTNSMPVLYKSYDTKMTLGFFEVSGEPMNMGRYCQLALSVIRHENRHDNGTEVAQIAIGQEDITKVISTSEFEQGRGNATFIFRSSAIQAIDTYGDFEILVWGKLYPNETTVFGRIPCLINESKILTQPELDSAITPLIVPRGTSWKVRANQQALYALPIKVEGNLVVRGSLVSVAGQEVETNP